MKLHPPQGMFWRTWEKACNSRAQGEWFSSFSSLRKALSSLPHEAVFRAISTCLQAQFGEKFSLRGNEHNFQDIWYFPHHLSRSVSLKLTCTCTCTHEETAELTALWSSCILSYFLTFTGTLWWEICLARWWAQYLEHVWYFPHGLSYVHIRKQLSFLPHRTVGLALS